MNLHFGTGKTGMVDYPEAQGPLAPVSLLGCAVCGGRMVEARGRHPGDAPRIVCPTCLADRMDMIREIAAPEYGRACSAQPNSVIGTNPRTKG